MRSIAAPSTDWIRSSRSGVFIWIASWVGLGVYGNSWVELYTLQT